MPKALDDMVKALRGKGMAESKAFAIATSQLQKRGVLQKGTQKLAKKAPSKSMPKK